MEYSKINLCFFLLNHVTLQVLGEPQFPCFFIFGDSLVDNGNNNYLQTVAKANYYPYGIDFPAGPTGRFTNGRNIADFIAELLGFDKSIPPFANGTNQEILGGVNYASGGAGILDETGSQFKLHDYGARKVAVFAVVKLGCTPLQLATYGSSNASSCVETTNNIVEIFNENLLLLINDLNNRLPNAKFVYTRDISMTASYGNIKIFSDPCCQTGRIGLCIPGTSPCNNRDEYRFWDEIHPTEAAISIAANIAYNDMSPLYADPIDVW